MTAEVYTDTFHKVLWNIGAHDSYLGSGLSMELLVARMLAAVRFAPQGDARAPDFLDEGREFTMADWQVVLDRMAERWRSERNEGFNPFEDRDQTRRLQPGTVENLRRLILASLDPKGQVPPALIEAAHDLSLTRRHGPVERLAPVWEQVVVDLVDQAPPKRVFCGYEATAGIALKLAMRGIEVRLDLRQLEAAALYACLALASDAAVAISLGDPMELADRSDATRSFDTAIVIPPINARLSLDQANARPATLLPYNSSESAGVALALTRSHRRAICLLPPSFLFKASKADQHFKELAVCDYGLETVVGLPRGGLPGASIMMSLLIFAPDKGRRSKSQGEVFFVDAVDRDRGNAAMLAPNELPGLVHQRRPGKSSVMASVDDVAANDFNLSPDRYVIAPEVARLRKLAEDSETVALDDLVEIYRPQALTARKGAEPDGGEVFLSEIGAADIDEVGLVRTPGKQVALSDAAASQARKALIEPGDVLLVIKGSVGKVGYVRAVQDGSGWLASQSFAVLRLRRHAPIADARVLFRFLSSGLGQASLHNLRVGSTVPGLQMADVRRLPIVLPDRDEQTAIVREVDELFAMQDHILQLRADLNARQSAIWPDALPSSESVDVTPRSRKRSKEMAVHGGRAEGSA